MSFWRSALFVLGLALTMSLSASLACPTPMAFEKNYLHMINSHVHTINDGVYHNGFTTNLPVTMRYYTTPAQLSKGSPLLPLADLIMEYKVRTPPNAYPAEWKVAARIQNQEWNPNFPKRSIALFGIDSFDPPEAKPGDMVIMRIYTATVTVEGVVYENGNRAENPDVNGDDAVTGLPTTWHPKDIVEFVIAEKRKMQ